GQILWPKAAFYRIRPPGFLRTPSHPAWENAERCLPETLQRRAERGVHFAHDRPPSGHKAPEGSAPQSLGLGLFLPEKQAISPSAAPQRSRLILLYSA